jgi:CheY-like chemotaxis protein
MTTKPKRVLIVDDEEDLTWSVSKNLARDHRQYELICVNSGSEALHVLNQIPVDLVVSDVRMPEISGLDLLMRIRDEFPGTRVIIMTAYGSEHVQKEVFRRGSIAYLEKPFEIEDLRELILKNLEERKGFVGQVSDFQLTDIIQMNCLGRLTTALKIKKGSEIGHIFFEEGAITHAEVSGLEGEEAFYEILSWRGGEFSSKKNVVASRETIFKGWQSLLLEGLKRSDETAPAMAEEREEDKRQRHQKIEGLLRNVLALKGVEIIAIVNANGFSLASVEAPEANPELLEEILGLGGKLFDWLAERKPLGGDDLRRLVFENSSHVLLLNQLGASQHFILIAGRSEINEGALRLAMQKIAIELQAML